MPRVSQAVFSRNRLLSILSSQDFERLRPDLERVSLHHRRVLEQSGEPIEHVYFPEPSVASVVAVNAGGERIEVGLFGPEGMSGLAVVHGADRSPFETFMQVAGSGIRIAVPPFRAALEASATLRAVLLLYGQSYAVQVAHTALANGRYTVDQRLARWLLMCHDRVDGDSIALTHEFLALMLGVRRAGVTTSLHALEGAGIIKAARGRIDILDRDRLLKQASDSYGVPEAEYDRLIGG